jgi:hypothetical protein
MISTTENVSGAPAVSLAEVETRALAYSRARTALADELAGLQEELENAKKRHMRSIKSLAAAAAAAEANLHAAIELGPHLFVKPRTLELHGVKVGYRTAQGRIVWDDEETVLKLIRRHLKGEEDVLIKTTYKVSKDGLKALSATDLAKIGCRVEGAGDQVVLSMADDQIEKMLSKLISEMVETILEEEK